MDSRTATLVIRAIAAVVVAALTAIAFFAECQSWSQCVARFHEPNSSEARHAAMVDMKFRNRLRLLCARADFAPMFARSPCRTTDFTADHLGDLVLVASSAELVALHGRALDDVITKYQEEMGMSGGARSAEVAAAYARWSRTRQRDLELLLRTNPTWGQLNTERRRQAAEKDDVVGCVHARGAMACGA
jgi:hypothetical protein